MNIKKIIYLANIFLICGCLQSQNKFSELKAKETLEIFYSKYIEEASKWPSNKDKLDEIIKEFCTENFINNNKNLSYDPFIKAQDIDSSWINSLKVIKDTVRCKTFTVSFYDKSSDTFISIKLSLVLDLNKNYKINNIID
ncbi:DUF3828 domain-containing protein [Polaribacter sp. HL-MS24]|uniref:DUF3828 domain-containing protein n=1 Tax=Polaribacter sp. HL-MS24 TaxID=3077735 RepID=UPI0029349E0C|nr:DUF3828 domain-containing protein [Polaribacter sp. HL-MS24]WOC39726.1 DUF3828 domain-containing protein [Polaribacter sp. HL-MS24]